MSTKTYSVGVLLTATVLAFASHAATPAQRPEQAAAMKVGLRRITETQYRHTIADVFGPGIKVEARFEPERREDGLLALGSAMLSLTSSGFEQYFALGRSISEEVLSESRREAAVTCRPSDPAGADDDCARHFVTHYGELLLRRPLTAAEIQSRLEISARGAKQAGDFYAGLELALTSLLIAPDFLFRVESAEPDPAHPEQYRLDAFSKATRLSFLLWDSTPDLQLLAAARSGALHSQQELDKQVDRMIASPKFQDGARAFFADMFQLDGFGNLVKDPAIYPKFDQSVAESAREQMLLRSMDLLVRQQGDYRDLFTSRQSYLNRSLAAVYQVPYASKSPWMAYEFPNDSERSGILTDIGFLSLHAHPGTSSPTRRGIKVLEIFMCQATPQPPANVDFSAVQDSTKGTVRGRLLDHMENEGCSGCHRRTDPLGLALEHFDGLGQLRTMENGTPIDVSAELKDVRIEGARGVAEYLRNEPKVPACLVRNVYSYGVGSKTYGRDKAYLTAQTQAFIASGYRFPTLVRQIASSAEFFKIVAPKSKSNAPIAAATVTQLQSTAE
ncbi:DUF1592 domain-containing protein [Steroidobacter agaridevorans]|uniref:DUF1592 domain-containing protein n=1 Tax=Steroidobacter agaridevorans TaxID=2695856 RepID=UPI00132CC0ED|nr:DUF1592 domain-containing protein [Steroidobacter agaridevorans]GFE85246.1 hypothetical protein GCM10011488_02000 [Steroidobacter agaridevorans]